MRITSLYCLVNRQSLALIIGLTQCKVGEYTIRKKYNPTGGGASVTRTNQLIIGYVQLSMRVFLLGDKSIKIDYDQFILWHIILALTDRVGWADGVCVNV